MYLIDHGHPRLKRDRVCSGEYKYSSQVFILIRRTAVLKNVFCCFFIVMFFFLIFLKQGMYRFYHVGEAILRISLANVKFWLNKRRYDSTFINSLMREIFSKEEMRCRNLPGDNLDFLRGIKEKCVYSYLLALYYYK